MWSLNARIVNMWKSFKLSCEKHAVSDFFILCFAVLTLIVLAVAHFHFFYNSNMCTGIGGFVYQEIEWAEQTYNIVNDCNSLDGLNTPVLFYDDDKKQFYCYERNDCNSEGCRSKKRYLDPIIQND